MNTAEQIQHEIVDAEPGERDRLIDQFIADRYDSTTYAVLVRRLCSTARLNYARQKDDVRQELAAEEHLMIREAIADPTILTTTRNWEGLLFVRTRPIVPKHVPDTGSLGMTGATTVHRRVWELAKAERRLSHSMMRQPTEQEIVDAANERLLREHKNAKRSGMMCTIDDLHRSTVAASLETCGPDSVSTPDTEDYLLHPVEGPKLVRRVIDALVAGGRVELAEFADLWLGDLYGDEPIIREPKELAEMLKTTKPKVTKRMSEVQQVAKEVLSSNFGITSNDWKAS